MKTANPWPVHPRSRGEHIAFLPFAFTLAGSSPLARGTRDAVPRKPFRRRFIPARAGNTSAASTRRMSAPVHPRSRGEHLPRRSRSSAFSGSSPLARGTHNQCPVKHCNPRFIPARAGNTRTPFATPRTTSVHPRSRGEHEMRNCARERLVGSSPLARGTLPRESPAGRSGRFIPARAGNTSNLLATIREEPVHPRSRGEHSSQNLLINRVFFDDKERTNCSADNSKDREVVRLALRGQTPVCSEQGDGMKRTSLKPSKSVGTRRFTPQVSKS